MATYRCARRLIDPVNNLHLPYGGIVMTECEAWVKRFGSDLQLIDDVNIASGVKIHHLVGLAEEDLTPNQPAQEGDSSVDLQLPENGETALPVPPVAESVEDPVGVVPTVDAKTIVRRAKS